MEDIPKLWLISAVLSLQELRNTQKRGGGDGNTEFFIVHGLDKRNVPKKKKNKKKCSSVDSFCFSYPYLWEECQAPSPAKKIDSTSIQLLTQIH